MPSTSTTLPSDWKELKEWSVFVPQFISRLDSIVPMSTLIKQLISEELEEEGEEREGHRGKQHRLRLLRHMVLHHWNRYHQQAKASHPSARLGAALALVDNETGAVLPSTTTSSTATTAPPTVIIKPATMQQLALFRVEKELITAEEEGDEESLNVKCSGPLTSLLLLEDTKSVIYALTTYHRLQQHRLFSLPLPSSIKRSCSSGSKAGKEGERGKEHGAATAFSLGSDSSSTSMSTSISFPSVLSIMLAVEQPVIPIEENQEDKEGSARIAPPQQQHEQQQPVQPPPPPRRRVRLIVQETPLPSRAVVSPPPCRPPRPSTTTVIQQAEAPPSSRVVVSVPAATTTSTSTTTTTPAIISAVASTSTTSTTAAATISSPSPSGQAAMMALVEEEETKVREGGSIELTEEDRACIERVEQKEQEEEGRRIGMMQREERQRRMITAAAGGGEVDRMVMAARRTTTTTATAMVSQAAAPPSASPLPLPPPCSPAPAKAAAPISRAWYIIHTPLRLLHLTSIFLWEVFIDSVRMCWTVSVFAITFPLFARQYFQRAVLYPSDVYCRWIRMRFRQHSLRNYCIMLGLVVGCIMLFFICLMVMTVVGRPMYGKYLERRHKVRSARYPDDRDPFGISNYAKGVIEYDPEWHDRITSGEGRGEEGYNFKTYCEYGSICWRVREGERARAAAAAAGDAVDPLTGAFQFICGWWLNTWAFYWLYVYIIVPIIDWIRRMIENWRRCR